MLTRKIAGTAVFALGLTLAAGGVASAQPANTQTCLQLSHQLSDALDSHQQSDNYQAARDQQSVGRTACLSGRFDMGAAAYTKALQLLGVSGSMADAH